MHKQCGKSGLHRILMILCCAIPLLLVAGLFLTKPEVLQGRSILSFGVLLLCPLGHLAMMFFMKDKKEVNEKENKASCH